MEKNTILIIAVVLVIGLYLANYADLFSIYSNSDAVQYYNEPIEAKFILTDYKNPEISAYFNDELLFKVTNDETEFIETEKPEGFLIYQKTKINQTVSFMKKDNYYILTVTGINQPGKLNLIVSENNLKESKTIYVENPYVNIESSFNNKIIVKTFTPQGQPIEADKVKIKIIDPKNNAEEFVLDKDGNTFSMDYIYRTPGTYTIKVYAEKEGYVVREATYSVSK